jgi:hypothetical protein
MSETSRQAVLAQLAARRLHAAKDQDWDALELADSQVAERLPVWAAQAPWTEAESRALHSLRLAHDAALGAAVAASQALNERIEQLQTGRDGWLAYALHSEHESESTVP